MSNNLRKSRRGSLVVCVLVCLLVAATIVTTTTQMALQSRREVRLGQQMRQTEFLLDAGVLRAARQIRAASDYRGESWRPTGAVTRFDNAQVLIRVTADEDATRFRRVEVIASLGVAVDDVKTKVASLTRRSHTFRIEATNPDSTNPDSPNAE